MLPTAAAALAALQKCFPLQPQHFQLCRNASYCSHSTDSFSEMLPTAAAALSVLQKCFPLQPQHSQFCRNASHCSHSTFSFAEMLPTAATALSAKCKSTQKPKFRTEYFSSFLCSCVLHTIAISQPRKGDPTLSHHLTKHHFTKQTFWCHHLTKQTFWCHHPPQPTFWLWLQSCSF